MAHGLSSEEFKEPKALGLWHLILGTRPGMTTEGGVGYVGGQTDRAQPYAANREAPTPAPHSVILGLVPRIIRGWVRERPGHSGNGVWFRGRALE